MTITWGHRWPMRFYLQQSNGLDALFKSTRHHIFWKFYWNLSDMCFRLLAEPEGPNSALKIRFWDIEVFLLRRETRRFQMFWNGHKYPVAPAFGLFTNSWGEAHMNILHLRNAFFHRWLAADDIRFFNPHAMLFDLGGTAKSRNFAHVRAHRRRVHRPLALDISQVRYKIFTYPKS